MGFRQNRCRISVNIDEHAPICHIIIQIDAFSIDDISIIIENLIQIRWLPRTWRRSMPLRRADEPLHAVFIIPM
jgi:hypothetical protein